MLSNKAGKELVASESNWVFVFIGLVGKLYIGNIWVLDQLEPLSVPDCNFDLNSVEA